MDHVRRNRALWNQLASEYAAAGERLWAAAEPTWGIWAVPEADLRLLPDDLAGADAVELGCGTAYVSSWLARRGARPVGVDGSPAQLATARRLQRQHGVHFPLLLADAESLPLADARFDLAISEYGAATWCDPYRWIPEAARVLRPGGQLVFLHNGALLMLAMNELENQPAEDRLLRPYFAMHRFEWSDSDGVEFNLGFGDWIRLFRSSGLDVIDLVEVQPAAGVTSRFGFVTPDWARRWPSEQVWKLRKQAA